MAPSGGKLFGFLTLLSFCLPPSEAWDSDDLELFDLVEEVNANFYDVFGITESALSSDVRKAYRRLSLQYHPDKNDAEDAEEKFRQIVAIYEVLKDEKKRERYNQVLIEGLPDWRQPVYYYRRARKLGIYELGIVLSVILTIGQYFVAWAVYIEKRLVMEEVLSAKRKKKEKKRKQADDGSTEDDEVNLIPTPHILDLWPFQLTVFIVYTIYNMPETMRQWQEARRRRRKEKEEEEAKAMKQAEEANEYIRKPKKRTQLELPEYTSEMSAKYSAPTESKRDTTGFDPEETEDAWKRKGEWSDEEIILLAKAVNRFPGATHQRWEKIAEMVGRSVPEVIAKARETKGNYSMYLNTSVQSSASKSLNLKISDDIITQNLPDDDDDGDDGGSGDGLLDSNTDNSKIRKRHKPTRTVKAAERTLLISQGTSATAHSNSSSDKSKISADGAKKTNQESWTQNQQTIFEWALKQYARGTENRWDLVAEHIPGKSKEDCIARFKELVELVSKKKRTEEQQQQDTTSS